MCRMAELNKLHMCSYIRIV